MKQHQRGRNVLQVFVRRRPPPWEASVEDRVRVADLLCAPLSHACATTALQILACQGAGVAGARESVKRKHRADRKNGVCCLYKLSVYEYIAYTMVVITPIVQESVCPSKKQTRT